MVEQKRFIEKAEKIQKYKKIIISFLIVSLIITSCTGCLKKKDGDTETPDSPVTSQTATTPSEKCKFNIEDTTDEIEDFAKGHGLRYKNRLCYRSDNHYKIDTTRIESDNDLLRAYQDAVYGIVSTGNNTNAKNIYFNIETVLTDDNGYFTLYISYEYQYDSDR